MVVTKKGFWSGAGLGLPLAVLALCLAVSIANIPPPWLTPLHYTPLLFLGYPLVFIRLLDDRHTSVLPDVALLAVAVVADFLFVRSTLHHPEISDGLDVTMAAVAWLAIWAYWQALPILAITSRAPGESPAQLLFKAAMVFVGLLVATLVQLLAFLLVATGEGWAAPASASFLLFLTYPVVLVRLVDRQRTSVRVEVALLLFAGFADVLLLVLTDALGWLHLEAAIRSEPPLAIIWLGFWFGWQLLAIGAFALALRRRLSEHKGSGEAL